MMTKPHLSLYIGRYVAGVIRKEDGAAWEWKIVLDNGVEIRNKDRRETFVPNDIEGARIQTISIGMKDTTIHFSNGSGWSLNPTQYSIFDPRHGGEVYPQWPEELEEAGIPSHPEEGVSEPPTDEAEWERHRQSDLAEHEQRIAEQARDFMEGEDGGSS